MADELARYGAPVDLVDAWKAAPRRGFEVLPENWDSVEAFVRCGSQWRHAGAIGLPVGLDYAGCQAALQMMGAAPTPRLFADFQIMEKAALPELAKRWSKR